MKTAISINRSLGCLILVNVLVASFAGSSMADEIVEHPLEPLRFATPRATLSGFLSAMEEAYAQAEAGNEPATEAALARAVRTLGMRRTLVDISEDEGIEAALMLKEVLDRIDLPPLDDVPGPEDTSSLVSTSQDALPASYALPHTEIRLVLVVDGIRAGEYLFSPETVRRIPEFYSKVASLPYKAGATPGIYNAYVATPGRAIHLNWADDAPHWMQVIIAGQTVWQWAALLVLTSALPFLLWILLSRGHRLDTRSSSNAMGRSASRIATLVALVAALATVVGIEWLLDEKVNITGTPMLLVTTILFVVEIGLISWLMIAAADQLSWLVISRLVKPAAATSSHMIRLFARIVAVLAICVLLVDAADRLGLPAYSVLGALGIAGLAISLAGQETLKSLFGFASILADRPYKVGDWVAIGNQEGVIEEIGIRSTRIQTFGDSMVSLPNSQVLATAVENNGRWRGRRIRQILELDDDTPPAKIEEFVDGVSKIIEQDSDTQKNRSRVVLNNFGESNFDILLRYFVDVPDHVTELRVRHRIMLEIIKLAHTLGVQFGKTRQIQLTEGVNKKEPA